MYTLLNILKLGADSILVDKEDGEMLHDLEDVIRLSFMSNFVFRLFENLSLD
jgi:hypothetical protein